MDGAIPARNCDIVMKGGITSGVVYPKAIAELAKEFRFKNVGGTSAGAIAAALAAAAEYARVSGKGAGFARLEQLPDFLYEGSRPSRATGAVGSADRRCGTDESQLPHPLRHGPAARLLLHARREQRHRNATRALLVHRRRSQQQLSSEPLRLSLPPTSAPDFEEKSPQSGPELRISPKL